MSGDFPRGWVAATIAELCEIAKEKGREGVVPYLEIGNIDISSKSYVLTAKASVKGCRVARKDDVLVSKVRPTRGAITWIREDELYVSSAFTVLRSKGALAAKCLWQFLAWNRDYLNFLGENCKGTMYPTTSDDIVPDFEMPLPPLGEQRRIVAKVEELLSRVGACQQRLAKIPVLLRRFRQSTLDAACSGRLTADWREQNGNVSNAEFALQEVGKRRVKAFGRELSKASVTGERKPRRPSNLDPKRRDNPAGSDLPDSWLWTSIEDIASTAPHAMSSGPFGSSLGRKDYQESGIPVVRSQNIQEGRFVPKEFVFISAKKGEELSRSSARPNDIVVVAVGVSAGESAVIPKDFKFGILSQNCNKITVDTELAVPAFVNFIFQIQIGLDQLRDRTTDTAREFLSLTNLRTLLLPLPPLAEQQEIVRRAEALLKTADTLEARYRAAKVHVDKLTQSILAKAFRGELVPQDPNDEPAAVLLERIRQERNGAANKTARATRKKSRK